jgi:hypothetical protein
MRLASALATIGVLSTGLVAAAPAAQAAGTCSLQVPSRVTISQPYPEITVRAGSDCLYSRTMYAVWDAYDPRGEQDGSAAIFEGDDRGLVTTSDVWELWDSYPTGRWVWRPQIAYDVDNNDIAQNTRYTDIKLGSWSRMTATRYGSRVTLSTSAARYSPTYDRFIAWGGAYGQLQYRVPGTSTWRALKTVYSNSSGAYRYTYATTAVRDYRVYFPATSAIWNTASPTVRK